MNPGVILVLVLCIAGLAFCCWGLYNRITFVRKERKEFEEKVIRAREHTENAIGMNISLMRENYNKIKNKISIPENCKTIDVETTVFGLPCKAQATAGDLTYLQNDFYCWYENNALFIFPTEEHLSKDHITYRTPAKDLEKRINCDDIKLIQIDKFDMDYYRIVGEEKSEMQIHTADTGVNIKGAVVGGLIAGEAGAIIGSQHGRNKVYSTMRHFDERYVELLYRDSGRTQKLKMSITAYPLLETWLPDKEYEFVVKRTEHSNDDPFVKIEKYKELLDKGVITQEEFDKKKKELLSI